MVEIADLPTRITVTFLVRCAGVRDDENVRDLEFGLDLFPEVGPGQQKPFVNVDLREHISQCKRQALANRFRDLVVFGRVADEDPEPARGWLFGRTFHCHRGCTHSYLRLVVNPTESADTQSRCASVGHYPLLTKECRMRQSAKL